jgi:protein phosphatase
VLALAVIGGGLYGGYRWTQTQYYVGTKGEHIALYRGIDQDLAWVSLSKVEKDHPEIELKYLPPYQRKQVEATIPGGDLSGAQSKIDELGLQASACKKDAERREVERENNAKTGEGEAGGSTGLRTAPTPDPTDPSGTTKDGKNSTTDKNKSKTAPTPTPGPSLSEDEQKLVPLCGKQ